MREAATRHRANTVAELVRARAHDDNVGLSYGDRSWTWREVVAEAAVRASWLSEVLDPARPPHVGVLLPNTPEYAFQMFGAALAGACVVGLNATRRGAELARDIDHTACQFVIADDAYADLVDGPLRVEDQPWVLYRDAVLPDEDPPAETLMCLLLTSGSTSAPKAAKCSQGRMAGGAMRGFGPDDTLYCPMPLSHGNALNAALFPALACGARLLLRDRFSAKAWLDDVRSHGVTFTNTVGRALGYVLATPPTPVDRDHRLKVVLAPEASPRDMAEFKERFGVTVLSGYGSSEGGIVLVPSRKPGSLGRATPDADVAVVDPAGRECERAQLDPAGKLRNAEGAIGELVRRNAGGAFEGYWNNPEADSDRLRDGWFWSGDLAYRDADDVFWFAGRMGDWLRVDSENFAASPVERIVGRFGPAAAVAVVGVPDPVAGDQVLAVVELLDGHTFDPTEFAEFLTTQTDLGTKWAPRFVRVTGAIPVLGNGKVDKRPLRRDAWLVEDPVWWRPAGSREYALMTRADRDALSESFAAHGRMAAYPSADD
ncbi:putative fatty-acid-CoA ligase FadD [Mycobacterium antarcticum]|uniref:AMP-binding protein n=1 Tax=unclassified Mycolicibacterium TaxID=2636767 RepID=UPI0023A26373|nr:MULTISPECIES: AMP-binding protein [unclassified Mycolicibacterium]BDX32817.1 putative fatty-acid-CoA ligase FadD [Mycolicibacterium sp. TUM20985]GLP76001.1 putative fatty-acid-CoA ligase FadD [Mycolicibacterium sp. TUM20983]